MLVNGKPADSIPVEDRGLLYGDGVFRTLRAHAGQPANWSRHYRKLQQDCTALGMVFPDASVWLDDIARLSVQGDAVLKLIVTRGAGERGYAPIVSACPTRIVACYPAPAPVTRPVDLHLCQIRLARQPRLAGIKHLNRLENVLAAQECQQAGKPEGVLLDEADNVISGTRSNLFMVTQQRLLTPDLSQCGVAGVQRERVMAWAAAQAVPCTVSRLSLQALREAEEIFLVNSVFGIWPVATFADREYNDYRFSNAIRPWLNDVQN
ncbi:MAG: aminodeoxychorismate lyase [Pseudomonadota bacterium]